MASPGVGSLGMGLAWAGAKFAPGPHGDHDLGDGVTCSASDGGHFVSQRKTARPHMIMNNSSGTPCATLSFMYRTGSRKATGCDRQLRHARLHKIAEAFAATREGGRSSQAQGASAASNRSRRTAGDSDVVCQGGKPDYGNDSAK